MTSPLVSVKLYFIVIVACSFFTLSHLQSGGAVGLNTKSPMRALKLLMVILPMSFFLSYFLAWKMLIITPREKLQQESPKWEQGYFLFKVWTLLLFVLLLFAHLSFPYMLSMGTVVEVSPVPYILFASLGTSMILGGVLIKMKVLEVFMSCLLSGFRWRWLECNWYLIRGALVAVIVSCLATVSMMNAAAGPVVKEVQVPVRKLPLSMNGMKVVQLSDIHIGPTVGRKQLQQAVATTNSLKPDIVVITGDLVDSTVEHLTDAVAPLSQLIARYGVFYVTGNHEYYTHDVKNWIEHLQSLGITCLSNKNVKIVDPARAQDWFYIAGTHDIEAKRVMMDEEDHFNLDVALEDTDSEHAVILLAHQPKAARLAIQSQYDISLILSGHTHGGQFYPANILSYLASPYFAGIYQPKDGSYVYVSSGSWYNGPPLRLFSRSEITLLTLLST
ncbi:transmembrane protein with metallophosphoesterase domain-like [Asterias amurensis]|uniref:transmembrane protein with metallophosphoesterase domain-like n=1 Tax=Asterias amurensis TaxID=7602 RepID=UPI003AB2AA5A